jgi:glycosyltransferase involved in cell wall biosynthesis
MCVYVQGFPHVVGGAGNECWWSSLLWKRIGGEDVHFIPTWAVTDPEWLVRVENEGFEIIDCRSSKDLPSITRMEGQTVVAFCNDRATDSFKTLREMGCRIVYCPLMCNVRSSEKPGYRQAFPDVIVFQSEYQRSKLEPQLKTFGYTPDKGALIRGGINFRDFDFNPRPHHKSEPFVVGRLARQTPSKWHKGLWKLYEQIPNRRAIIMGAPRYHVGPPPAWGTCLEANAMPSGLLYRQLHAYVSKNGTDDENWPAVGREAMAYGVPLVVEDAWGWKEMIVHGETGFLCKNESQFVKYATLLSEDEELRVKIATQARERLESTLCNPAVLWAQWREVL